MLEYEDVTKDVDVSWVRAMYENPSEEQMAAGRKALLSGSVGGEMPIQIAKARAPPSGTRRAASTSTAPRKPGASTLAPATPR